jgi:hypothetical protein
LDDLVDNLHAESQEKLLFELVNCLVYNRFLKLENKFFSFFIRNIQQNNDQLLKLALGYFGEQLCFSHFWVLLNESDHYFQIKFQVFVIVPLAFDHEELQR